MLYDSVRLGVLRDMMPELLACTRRVDLGGSILELLCKARSKLFTQDQISLGHKDQYLPSLDVRLDPVLLAQQFSFIGLTSTAMELLRDAKTNNGDLYVKGLDIKEMNKWRTWFKRLLGRSDDADRRKQSRQRHASNAEDA